MKGKKRNFRILAYVLSLCLLLSSCASGSSQKSSAQGGETSQSQEISEASSTESTDAGSNETGTPEGLPEQKELSANMNEVLTNFAATLADFKGTTLEPVSMRSFAEIPPIEIQEPEVYSKEDLARVKRTMRDYKRTVSVQIINNAEEYFVYDKLTKEQQGIYDAYYLLAQDPTTQDNIVSFQTSKDINSEEIWPELMMPMLALVYDHPELWWMYPWNGTAEVSWGVGEQKNGKTTLYAGFVKTYPTFEQDVAAFNRSVSQILSGINVNVSEEKIALQVHDKLIDLCTYDDAVLQEGRVDFAHTAYGPIVGDSLGNAHWCVCDGYAQAYVYLLQQLGVTAAVVLGPVSNAGADGQMGLHAWNIARIDGRWYEVDVCWDDMTYLPDAVKNQWDKTANGYQYYLEMVNDKVYMDRLYHYMFMITTKEISNHVPGDNLYYTSRDGRARFCPIGASQRWRIHEKPETGNGFELYYTMLLPQADGTLSDSSTGSPQDDDDWDDDDDVWDGGSGDITDLIGGADYKQIAGTYYVSKYNQYTQSVLEQYYGKDYYKQLSMFELKANGSGTIYENGSSLAFNFIFDGTYLYMYSNNGGCLFLMYSGGDFLMSDYYGNIYTFSKLK